MKVALCAIATLVVATLQAGIASWTAGGQASFSSSYINGTAYFLEVKESGPTLTSMIESIKTNGLSGSSDAVTLLGTDTILFADGYYGTLGGSFDPELSPNSTSTYYVLFVDANKETFIFSNGTTVADWTGAGVDDPQYDVTVYEGLDVGQGSWAGNGGTIGTIPEPTALALLALGVAGLALRRRCA